MRTLSIGIRKNYKKKELRAVREGAGDNEMEIIHDGQYDGMDANDTDDTDVKEDVIFIKEVIIIKDEEEYAQWEGEDKMMPMLMAMDQENHQVKDTIEGMDAEPIKLEHLLGLMKVYPQTPSIVISTRHVYKLTTIHYSLRCLLISQIWTMNISIGMKSLTLATPNR